MAMKLPKKRIGKPYSQQAGRKAGKGAGKIVADDGLGKVKIADVMKIDEMLDWMKEDLEGIASRIDDAQSNFQYAEGNKDEERDAIEEADGVSYEVEAHIKALEKYADGILTLQHKFRGNLNTYVEDVAIDTQDVLDSLYPVASVSDQDQMRAAVDNCEEAARGVDYLQKSVTKLLSVLRRKKLPIRKSRIGKPYSQQKRKHGKGKGKIVDGFSKKVKTYIKDAYAYYATTQVIPDGEDIANDVITQMQDDIGSTLTQEEQRIVWRLVTGEDEEPGAEDMEKAIGKPYSQQPGRKAGKGAGKIVIKQPVIGQYIDKIIDVSLHKEDMDDSDLNGAVEAQVMQYLKAQGRGDGKEGIWRTTQISSRLLIAMGRNTLDRGEAGLALTMTDAEIDKFVEDTYDDKGVVKQPDVAEPVKGATCPDCGRNMVSDDGCTMGEIKIGSKWYRREAYGEAGEDTSMPCGDCGTKAGNYHHFGCDLEYCPKCGDQLAFCECNKKGTRQIDPIAISKEMEDFEVRIRGAFADEDQAEIKKILAEVIKKYPERTPNTLRGYLGLKPKKDGGKKHL